MKYKKIEKKYFKVILDRLFRVKPADERYKRVFDDILNKYLIKENCDFSDPLHMSVEEKIKLAVEIFNSSIDKSGGDNTKIYNYITRQEQRLFKKSELSNVYLGAKLDYAGALELIKNEEDLKPNLKQMLYIKDFSEPPKTLRRKYSLLYPVEKILLCEGATEEILLGEFCGICGYDFKKEGVYVIGAGGKNQVARRYYEMIEEFKIPIFVLMDEDANATKELIEPKLRDKDKIYIIKSGEFEDIIPKELITKALNARYESSYTCREEDFHEGEKRTKELHEIFKQSGFGEYKKAEFAKTLKEFMQNNPPKAQELGSEIRIITDEIKTL